MDPIYRIVACARAAHEVNRAYCIAMGDLSQPAWEEAPEWQKNSAINGVRSILDGTIQSPEQSHEGWMAQKLAEGWKHGPLKDPERKEHPCMVPYAQLPASQTVKDDLFFATVLAMGKATLPFVSTL